MAAKAPVRKATGKSGAKRGTRTAAKTRTARATRTAKRAK